MCRKMSRVSGHKKIGLSRLGTLQEAVILIIRGDGKRAHRATARATSSIPSNRTSIRSCCRANLSRASTSRYSASTAGERHRVNAPSRASSTMVAGAPSGLKHADTTMFVSRTARTIYRFFWPGFCLKRFARRWATISALISSMLILSRLLRLASSCNAFRAFKASIAFVGVLTAIPSATIAHSAYAKQPQRGARRSPCQT